MPNQCKYATITEVHNTVHTIYDVIKETYIK